MPRPATLLKKRLWHRCFPVNFAKFLWAPFLQNTSGRLLLLFFYNIFKSNRRDFSFGYVRTDIFHVFFIVYWIYGLSNLGYVYLYWIIYISWRWWVKFRPYCLVCLNVLFATLLKVTLLYGCFSLSLNCTNDTKSRKTSHYIIISTLDMIIIIVKLFESIFFSSVWYNHWFSCQYTKTNNEKRADPKQYKF